MSSFVTGSTTLKSRRRKRKGRCLLHTPASTNSQIGLLMTFGPTCSSPARRGPTAGLTMSAKPNRRCVIHDPLLTFTNLYTTPTLLEGIHGFTDVVLHFTQFLVAYLRCLHDVPSFCLPMITMMARINYNVKHGYQLQRKIAGAAAKTGGVPVQKF